MYSAQTKESKSRHRLREFCSELTKKFIWTGLFLTIATQVLMIALFSSPGNIEVSPKIVNNYILLGTKYTVKTGLSDDWWSYPQF